YLKSVIGNGFRDSTRIAAGPAEVWEQIFTENSAAMIRHLDALIENLHQWREWISRSDSGAEIVKILDEVSRHRQDLAADTGAAGTVTPQ
ncbi:prephenate dehydrogenase/arogenate dehydrogenase family protein, partial [Candidatus Sumerlaeota bacterium]|nr:prephenate dehydrogenase/arogenate dehydrogenase family protein [Candidatus Sumerlaeota bacterium]